MTIEAICETIEGLQRHLQGMRATKVAKLLASKPINVVDGEKYKVLSEFGIPLNFDKIQALLQDINKLNDDLPDGHDVLSIPSFSDRYSRKLLSVPRSISLERFERNAWNGDIITDLLTAMMPLPLPVDNQQEEQKCEQQKRENEIAAMWLLTATGQKHPEAFVLASSKLGYPLHSKSSLLSELLP